MSGAGARPRPVRGGLTHSRYTPSWMRTVSPGMAARAARLIVRIGEPSSPVAESEPVGET